MDVSTIQSLSGTLIEKLGITNTTFLSAIDSLSSVPIHPYERLIHEHFGPNYKFPTIDDILMPMDFCIRTTISKLTSINAKQQEVHDTHYAEMENLHDHAYIGHAFATLSGDTFVVNNDQVKRFIEFHEIVRSIPTERINSFEAPLIAQKLLHHYTTIF
jgi:hypothetical protein